MSKSKILIQKISPFLIVWYFAFTYLPYFVGRFKPLMEFFANYDLYYRGILSIIFITVSFLCYAFSSKFDIKMVVLFLILCCYFLIGAFCLPKEITVRHVFKNSNSAVDATLTIGLKDIFSGILNSFFDLYFCFYLISFGKQEINKKTLKLISYFVLVSSLLECFFTFVLDRQSYLAFLSLNFNNIYDLNISGTFQSKNGLGFLLFQGVISCFILLMINRPNNKIQRVFICMSLALIMIVSTLSFCKTSALISFFACLAFILNLVFKKRSLLVRRIISVVGVLFFVVFIIIVFFIPRALTIKGIGSILGSIKYTILERLLIWYEATYLMKMPQLFFGYSKGVSSYLLHLVDETLSSFYFHNGFVTIFVNYGLFGLILYVCLVAKIYKRSAVLKENLKKTFNIVFWSSIIYTCLEAYHLFLSGSPVVMLQSIIIVYLPVLYSEKIQGGKLKNEVDKNNYFYIVI